MKNKKVIVFEKDPGSLGELKKFLRELQYDIVGVAQNCEEILKKTQEHFPDIVLFDSKDMPTVERDEIRRQFHDQSVPVLFFENEKIRSVDFPSRPESSDQVALFCEYAIEQMQERQRALQDKGHYAAILNQVSEGVIHLAANLEIQDLNVVSELMIGSMRERLIGQQVDKVLQLFNRKSKQALGSFETEWKNGTLSDKGQNPFIYRSMDGVEKLVKVQVVELNKLAQGNELRWALLLQDVTQVQYVEKAFGVVASTLEHIDVPVMITDVNFDTGYPNVVYTNKAFLRFTGYTEDELANQSIKLFLTKESKKGMSDLLYKAMKTLRFMTDETLIKSKSGDVLDVYNNVFCIYDAKNEPIHLVNFFHDVTQLRRLEENIRQSQKVEGIGRFTGGIAHDFNNLLAVINSYSDLLALKVKDNETLLRYISNIRTAGERGASLVSQLMTFSRREVNEPKPLCLGSVVSVMQDMMERVISEDINIYVSIEDDLRKIFADISQMEQILVNLCVNARDAIEDRGTITISVSNCSIDADSFLSKEHGISIGDHVLLSIEDTGAGMDLETQKKIFEPFFTTKAMGKGTGLGLATVYGIIKKMGGSIHLDSELGRGTIFNIYLPACDENLLDHSNQIALSRNTANNHILVLDDEEIFTDCISAILNINGFDADYILSKQFDVSRIAENIKSYNLLIIDSGYNGGKGFNLAEQLLKAHPGLELIFLINNEREADYARKTLSSSSVMMKPLPLNAILTAVHERLDVYG